MGKSNNEELSIKTDIKLVLPPPQPQKRRK
jgi:hypothetical protein